MNVLFNATSRLYLVALFACVHVYGVVVGMFVALFAGLVIFVFPIAPATVFIISSILCVFNSPSFQVTFYLYCELGCNVFASSV